MTGRHRTRRSPRSGRPVASRPVVAVPRPDALVLDEARALALLDALRKALQQAPEVMRHDDRRNGLRLGPRNPADARREAAFRGAAISGYRLLHLLVGTHPLRELLPLLADVGARLGEAVVCRRPWAWCRDRVQRQRFALVHVVDWEAEAASLGLVLDLVAPSVPDALLEPVRKALFELVGFALAAKRLPVDLYIVHLDAVA